MVIKLKIMREKFLTFSILSILILNFLIPNIAHAKGSNGFFWSFPNIKIDQWAEKLQSWFQNVANILGLTVDEVKNYWAEGKNIKQIIEEKGISQEEIKKRIKENCLSQLKSQLQFLVEKGIITQEQADKRYQVMEKQIQEGRGCKMNLRGFFEMNRKRFPYRFRFFGF